MHDVSNTSDIGLAAATNGKLTTSPEAWTAFGGDTFLGAKSAKSNAARVRFPAANRVFLPYRGRKRSH